MNLVWLWLACAPPGPHGEVQAPAELQVSLDGAVGASGGVVVVRASYDASGELEIPEPASPGVTFAPDGPPRTERIGDRDAVTQRYVFRAPAGSHEIPPLVATWTGADGVTHEATSDALFFDVSTKAPSVGELADIVEPPPVHRVPWVPILSVAALAGAGLVVAFLPRKRKAPEPDRPPPPDVLCLRAWDAVRHDSQLTVDDKALALSLLFRVYVEAVLGFEATARTTSELLEHLRGLRHLPEGNVTRAHRVLRATDRVKFAEERPPEEWVAELDADLRAFVASTRPRVWKEAEHL